MTIRALLFDLWGTLLYIRDVDDMEARRRRLLDRTVVGLANAGHPYAEETVAAALSGFGDEHSAMHREGRDISQPERLALVLERIEPGLATRMSGTALLAVEDAVADVRLRDSNPAPGALACVEEAHGRGLALGLVCVTGLTPGYVLRDVLDGHGLLRHFEALTFSDEARMAKPAPEIFHCTLQVLGVALQDAVFIGDTPFADVAGPQALGMTAVQVGNRQEDGVTPDARIDSLEELFPALARLGLVD